MKILTRIPTFYYLAIAACIAIVLLTVACTGKTEPEPNLYQEYQISDSVSRMHDDANNVTCYLHFSTSISCLPDSQIKTGR